MRTRSTVWQQVGGDTPPKTKLVEEVEDREVELLSLPLHTFHQPPPSYRPNRPPLFPVPPPGSCLVPPPPLPKGEGEFSPKWTEIPPPLSKCHSWPRVGGDTPSYYSYHKRPATQRGERSCQSAPSLECGGAGLRSSLDPNSRPFTPAFSSPGSCEEDEAGGVEVLHYSSHQPQAQLGEECPLPRDPSTLLPSNLDSSTDEELEMAPARPRSSSIVAALFPIAKAPILPLTQTWGNSRPPLLPTPLNFPPYGPRALSFSPTDFLSSTSGSTFTFPKEVEQLAWQRSRRDTETSLSPSISDLEARYQQLDPLEAELPPWQPDLPSRPSSSLLDIAQVPEEYLTSKIIAPKLPAVDLARAHTDLLFFMFYTGHNDSLQLAAASLLFERGWRYNTTEKVWLARWPGITPTEKTSDWEEGLYQFFDPTLWRRVPHHFRLTYSELAEKTAVSLEDLNPTPRFRATCLRGAGN